MTAASDLFAPEPVRRAREQVETQLREAILSGVFTHGSKLPSEAELSASFGVSRTTVREALRSLANAGLINKVPGATGGSFVQAMDHRALESVIAESMDNILRLGSIDYSEVAQVRRFLEVPSASEAARNRTAEQLEALEGFVARETEIAVDDPDVATIDIEFHSEVASASGNRVLASFVSALHLVTRPVTMLILDAQVGAKTVRQHRKIVEAIAAQDPSAAGAAMAEHLDYVKSKSRQVWRQPNSR